MGFRLPWGRADRQPEKGLAAGFRLPLGDLQGVQAETFAAPRQPENRNGAATAGVFNKVLPLGMLSASRRRAIVCRFGNVFRLPLMPSVRKAA
ncbi:MAG: hypothetical protein ACFNS8_06520 [Kingella oralis]